MKFSPWLIMVLLSFSIYFAFKWITFKKDARSGSSRFRSFAYLFLWPGMDAKTFLDPNQKPIRPNVIEWIMAIAKTGLGILLIWGVARLFPQGSPLLIGWISVSGFLFLFHFGTFHILSLLWRELGIDAPPIMNRPFAATSVSDFWSNRWNLGFRQLTHDFLLRPLHHHRHFGLPAMTLLPFLASGIVHDLVISLPPRGGYGFPTLYFAMQGFGVLLERSPFGKNLGLHRGRRGWLFALFVIAGPAYWLFHPPFMKNVMFPLMQIIGAVPNHE